MAQAYAKHRQRFPNGPPAVADAPKEVWINKPKLPDTTQNPSQ